MLNDIKNDTNKDFIDKFRESIINILINLFKMENEYITNNDTDDLGEDEILTKLKKAEEELSAVKAQLDEKNKLCLDQTHKIEEMNLENKNLKDENTNLQNLLKFYEDNEEKPNQPNESE